jgi:hypothetical protein
MNSISETGRMAAGSQFVKGSGNVGAVSWGAVLAGATGAAAFSLIMILLGTGLGLTVISPWGSNGISATTATVSTIVWITVVQALASVLGGYLAGRLRSRWLSVHMHEVYFRDTAHGFLAWAVATLLMATLLSTAVGKIASTGLKTAGAAVTVAAAAAAASDDQAASESPAYFVDSLFRPGATGVPATPSGTPGAPPANAQFSAARTAEAVRIFANALKSGAMPAADSQYLGQVVSSGTGLSPDDAQKRVTATFNQFLQAVEQAAMKAKQAADDARKASAYMALWLVVSLLVGAFAASWSATFGGRLRDSSSLPNY